MDSDPHLAHQRFRRLALLAVGAFALSLVIGTVGGWLVWEAQPAGSRVYGIELLLPGIIAVIVLCLPIRMLRKRWFPTAEALAAAATRPTTDDKLTA